MLKNFNKFRALTSRQKKFWLHAFFLLGIMRLATWTTSFERLSYSLQHHPSQAPQKPLDDKQLELANTIGRAVVSASRHTPWNSNCLTQAFTAQRMLNRNQIPGLFFLGLKKNSEQLQAHAWLKCDDHILTGKHGHEDYTIMSTFSWL